MLDLKNIRQKLHQLAETSMNEIETAKYLKNLIQEYSPTEIIEDLGGHSFAAVFSRGSGKTLLFRADLDALPIHETIECEYASKSSGVSHKCGHDGHMVSVLSLLNHLKEFNGKLILFFQSAEETGEGAKLAVSSSYFTQEKIDYVFSYHNLPEVELGKVYLSQDIFSCASVGLKINLKGESSHASQPDKALSPHEVISEFLALSRKHSSYKEDENFKLFTITHLEMGAKSFGITPGGAEIFITLRALDENKIILMKEEVTKLLKNQKLHYEISESDFFPSTQNSQEVAMRLSTLFKKTETPFEMMKFPNRWSEDFGYFTQKFKGVYLGIGAGKKVKPLHHPEYDFPDALLPHVEKIFHSILTEFSKND